MRIVSLVPAGTEIVCALGAGDSLVAVTHDCDHPPAVRDVPRITRSTIEIGSDSARIDAAVRAAAERGESTFHLDAAALAAARADVLIGQTLCHVCAITLDQLPAPLGPAPVRVPLDAGSLDGIFGDIARVATAIGREDEAAALTGSLRERIRLVEESVRGRPRPRVACLEWLDPLFNAGHWVPEQVALAGGNDVLGMAGARSRVVEWAEVLASRPDVLCLMPCGFDATRAERESRRLHGLAGWDELPAVRAGRVHALDGNAYFSRPGPRVVDGIEILARLFHPAQPG